MKKALSIFALLLFITSVNAQTSTELVGKWRLVKWTAKNGKEKDIAAFYKTTDVFQVFDADGKFQSIVGEKVTKGKWKLSKDNKKLTVNVLVVSETFTIDSFDAKHRVITNDQYGTFEYDKE